MRKRVDFVEGSAFWKARAAFFALKRRFGFTHDQAPPPIPRRTIAEAMEGSDRYTRWLMRHEPRPSDLDRLREAALLLSNRPSIAILLDAGAGDVTGALAHASAQIYPEVRVELTSAHLPDAASRFAEAFERSADDVIAFVAAGELLAPDAAFEAALAFMTDPEASAVYGDRDVVEADGRRTNPAFVSDFAPESFLAQMFMGRILFYRRAAVVAAGGVRAGRGDARYDLALRVSEGPGTILHRARIFYSARAATSDVAERTAAADARAAAEALARRGEPGRIEPAAGFLGAHHVRYVIARPGRIEIVVPTRDLPGHLARCIASVFERSTYRDIRLTVVDNGSVQNETTKLLTHWREREPQRFGVLRIDEPFNFSRLINAGVASSDAPYIVLLNNDTEVRTSDWLEAMLEQAQRPAIGAVGARLLYPEGPVQHAGVVVGIGLLAGHVYRMANARDPGPNGALAATRNYSAVTAACLMVRRDAFDAVGGFDESFAVEFNDVDFCLRLRQAGYRNVCLPHVELVHDESKTRGVADTAAKRSTRLAERTRFQERWHSATFRDPYYNEWLTRIDESGGLPD